MAVVILMIPVSVNNYSSEEDENSAGGNTSFQSTKSGAGKQVLPVKDERAYKHACVLSACVSAAALK